MKNLKKIIAVFVLISTLVACGSSKTVRVSKKVIKGEWTLKNVTFSNYGTYKVTFFNDVTKNCLEGSTWSFVPNNNSGIYSIVGDNCVQGDRNFIFTIQEIDEATGLYDFLLKPTNEKNKSEDNKGFRLRLAQLSDTDMVWEQTASIDGKTIKMNLNFIKQ
ncbi:MAG: lipocalin [Lutibacter sp.]|nr:lipocalin [Lutibacter sp.]